MEFHFRGDIYFRLSFRKPYQPLNLHRLRFFLRATVIVEPVWKEVPP